MTTRKNQERISSNRFAVINLRDDLGMGQKNVIAAPTRGQQFETQSAKKEIPVPLAGGGHVLARVTPDKAPTKENIAALEQAMNTPALRGRSVQFKNNKNPYLRLATTKNFQPQLEGGVLPAFEDGARATVVGVSGSIRGNNAKIISRGRNDFSHTNLRDTGLDLDTDGGAILDNSNLVNVGLRTNALPNAANARIIGNEASSNIHIAVGAKLPNSTVTGRVTDLSANTAEAAVGYVSYVSQQQAKAIGSASPAVMVREAQKAQAMDMAISAFHGHNRRRPMDLAA